MDRDVLQRSAQAVVDVSVTRGKAEAGQQLAHQRGHDRAVVGEQPTEAPRDAIGIAELLVHAKLRLGDDAPVVRLHRNDAALAVDRLHIHQHR